MNDTKPLLAALARFERVDLGHLPTPLEPMPNLGADLGLDLWVKRDDCTGVGLGGNKVRQLAYYFGKAQALGADSIVITGAVQSNFVRTAAAFAAICEMACHVQLEERVPDVSDLYRSNGNVLLDNLLGATLYSFPGGEDEARADAAVNKIADDLRAGGKTPYIIPLGVTSVPTGALGYAMAAVELNSQLSGREPFDEIIVPTGSALTHAGLLFGLRAMGDATPVRGICVRRSTGLQRPRVQQRLADIAEMMSLENPTKNSDIRLFDDTLDPGYGRLNDAAITAIRRCAGREGLLLDPVYTGKTMAGLLALAARNELVGKRVLFWHTGGTPALFGYGDQLT